MWVCACKVKSSHTQRFRDSSFLAFGSHELNLRREHKEITIKCLYGISGVKSYWMELKTALKKV